MAQVAQRSCGYPLPGSVQGQGGWDFEQSNLAEGVPTYGKGVGTRWSLRSLPTPTILWWFYDDNTTPLLTSWLTGTPENFLIARTHREGGEGYSSTVCINKDNWLFLLHIYPHCCLPDSLFQIFNFTLTLFHCSMLVLTVLLFGRKRFDSLVFQHQIEHCFLGCTLRHSPFKFPALYFLSLCKRDFWD